MNKVLQATYLNGSLLLDEKLDTALEGKKLTLILVEDADTASQSEVDLEEHKRQFFEWSQQYAAKLPPDYKFDREEAHER
ncbi:MAG: hypothetical protein DCF21_15400 [Leptolyngbya sp.]|jgi:hypothetical protein|nr:MAG: hypothetical protein DCF21_15400 [Leptolyngbya sp.]